jgi:hypothetical protein
VSVPADELANLGDTSILYLPLLMFTALSELHGNLSELTNTSAVPLNAGDTNKVSYLIDLYCPFLFFLVAPIT